MLADLPSIFWLATPSALLESVISEYSELPVTGETNQSLGGHL